MSRTGTTYATWALSALVAGSLALGGSLATAADKRGVDRPSDTSTTEHDARTAAERRDKIQPHPGGLVEAQWLMGETFHDPQGKDIGKIAELWLDPKDGRIKDVGVTMGDAFGIGGRKKIVAWNDVKIAWKDQKIHLTVDPTALRDAYQVKMDKDDRGPAASPPTAPKR
ncbi:MAG: PRC-barrel domain-containing protein [Candidatus Rokubacteria bacterium]|nr:PRC-barrel domain-containing protein [Candidatus Rokubacteria bacterium]